MSLEAALAANTAALIALTAQLAGAPAAAAPAKTTAAKPPAKAEGKPPAPPATTDPIVVADYAKVKEAFLAMMKAFGPDKNVARDKALAVIAPLPTLKDLETGEKVPGQYAALLAKITAATTAAV